MYRKNYNQVEYVAKSAGQQEPEGYSQDNKATGQTGFENRGGQSRTGKKNNAGRDNYENEGRDNKPYRKNNNNNRRGNNQEGQAYQDNQTNNNTQNTQNIEGGQNRRPNTSNRGQNFNKEAQEFYPEGETQGDNRGESRGGRGGRGNRGRGRGGRGGRGRGGQDNRGDREGEKPVEEQKKERQVRRPQQTQEERKVNEKRSSQEGSKERGSDSDGGEEHEIEDFSNVPMSELAEILKDRFLKNQIECPICFNKIRKDAKMWSCKQCFGPFHLGCIQKWINKNPLNLKDGKIIPNLKYYTWACPKCNYNYTEEQPDYKCFCGKEHNPEYDPYNIPHSCANTCGKIRGAMCVHPCPLGCHPGPCPPCRSMGREMNCFCGSKKMRVRCGEEASGFSCKEICNKVLNCGKHHCTDICHPGVCTKCPITTEVDCHCGKKKETRNCGSEDFTCHQVCGKTLNCGNHTCKAVCHSGPCEECPYTPDKMDHCCCGRMSAMVLGADNRKSCLDPIPVCGLPCQNIMECGHKCKKACHPYECGPCKEIVTQLCRCGKSDRKIECWKTTHGDEEDRVFMCDRVCKKSKSCRVHKCQRVCCDANKGSDPEGHHLCLKVCGKLMNCGKHTCSEFCHLGNCRLCPVIINHPMSCACGKTVKYPPLPCDTPRPECNQPCSRSRPCGHPCYLKCHYDECSPCEELIEKPCRCGKKMMKNVRCGRETLCGVPCDTMLPCGHKCGLVCHLGACDMERGIKGCGTKCKKIKEKCGHPCEALCHPNLPCPDKCRVQVKITCNCGNKEALVYCENRDNSKLECDKSCANLKRFGSFLQKIDTTKKPYYPAILVRFAKNNLNYLLKIEDKIEKMVKEGQEMTDIPVFEATNTKKHALYQLLSRTYCLELEFFLHVKNPSIIVRWTKDSKLPTMTLSEYLRQIETGNIKPDLLPFEATIKFYNLSMHDSIEELVRVLKEYKDEYYIERADKQAMAHFWKKDVAESALKVIKKSNTNFASAILEENVALKAEEEKLAALDADVKQATSQNESENDAVFLALNK